MIKKIKNNFREKAFAARRRENEETFQQKRFPYFSRKDVFNLQKGFTLIEMLVVVAIVVIITAVVLIKQSKFSSDILVTDAAYEVALSIREAQVYGTASKDRLVVGDSGYGANFSTTNGAMISGFYVFSDIGYSDGDGNTLYPFVYTPNLSEYSITDNITLNQGQKIRRFCAHSTISGGYLCSDGVGSAKIGSPNSSLNIGFLKPDPEAIINISSPDTTSVSPSPYDSAIIVIQSSLGDKCRVVKVDEIGQIAVEPVGANDCSAGTNGTYSPGS